MAGKITTGDVKTVGKVAALSGFFVPNDDQKRLKVTFWRRWNAGPVRSDDEITAAAIAQITDSSVIEQYWKDEKFRSWFKIRIHSPRMQTIMQTLRLKHYGSLCLPTTQVYV